MALTKISTGGVKDDAASQAKIADEAIDEARLQVSNAGSNGQFLQKQSGSTGGLTWATATTDISGKANLSGADFTGEVALKDNTHQLKFYDDDDSAYLHFKAPSTVASNVNWTLPAADGSAGQYLKTDGSGNLSFNTVTIPPSGNTVDLVADGAIAAGKAVQLKTNGKIEEIKETIAEANIAQKITNLSYVDSNTNKARTAYDPTNRKLVQIWMANESGYEHVYYRVHTINETGTAFSDQGDQNYIISNSTSTSPDHNRIIFEPNQGKFVMFSGKDRSDSNKNAAWVGTVNSNNTITWSDKTTVDTTTYECAKSDMCFDSTNNMVVVVYGVYNTGLKYVAGTMDSNGDMTWGSNVTIESLSGNQMDGGVSVEYDSTTDRIVAIWREENSGGARSGKIKIGQRTSANTITWGSTTEWHDQDFETSSGLACVGGKVIVTFSDKNDSRKLKYRVGTLSSSSSTYTITWGSTTATGLADHSFYNDLCYVPSIDKLVLSYLKSPSNSNSNNDDSRLAKGAISGTSITWSNDHEFNSTSVKDQQIQHLGGTIGTKYAGFVNSGSSGHGGENQMYLFHAAAATSNQYEGGKRFLGFAPSAINDGATGTVNTDGNTIDNQSGLTAGTRYYVQDSGALGTGTSNGSGVTLRGGGLALSASKVLIRYKDE